jgi:hypothetical protein
LINLLGVYHYDARGARAESADLLGSESALCPFEDRKPGLLVNSPIPD